MSSNSTGLQENVAGALSYLFGWITGIIFYLLEPGKPFVRFHAVQSIIVFGVLTILVLILSWIPVLGWIFSFVIWAIWVILWLVLMIKAYRGERYKLPVIGDMVEKWAHK